LIIELRDMAGGLAQREAVASGGIGQIQHSYDPRNLLAGPCQAT
jgi:hypothetical protein